MNLRVTIQRHDAIAPQMRQNISAAYRQAFPDISESGVDAHGTEWQDSTYRVLVWHNGAWAAVAGVVVRDILVGEERVRVGGVGGVLTLPEVRGLGLGKLVMRRAADFACHELNTDAGMLYCAAHNIPFYAGLGWELLERRVTHHQSDGARLLNTEHDHAMVLPCGGFALPDGDIDVQGRLW
jgi:GNAT superfamily N-acetyltransferase